MDIFIQDALKWIWNYHGEKGGLRLYWRDRLIATIIPSPKCFLDNKGSYQVDFGLNNMPLFIEDTIEVAKTRTLEFWAENREFFQCYLPKKHYDFMVAYAKEQNWHWDVVLCRALEVFQLHVDDQLRELIASSRVNNTKFPDSEQIEDKFQWKGMKESLLKQSEAYRSEYDAHGGAIPPKDVAPKENVNHPKHYNAGKIEVIDFIDDQKLGFALGNTVKYVCRSAHKGTKIEDLKKALWYLQHEIDTLEKDSF